MLVAKTARFDGRLAMTCQDHEAIRLFLTSDFSRGTLTRLGFSAWSRQRAWLVVGAGLKIVAHDPMVVEHLHDTACLLSRLSCHLRASPWWPGGRKRQSRLLFSRPATPGVVRSCRALGEAARSAAPAQPEASWRRQRYRAADTGAGGGNVRRQAGAPKAISALVCCGGIDASTHTCSGGHRGRLPWWCPWQHTRFGDGRAWLRREM